MPGHGQPLQARKMRKLELKAGHQARRRQKDSAFAHNIKGQREKERRFVEQAETAYARFVAGWRSKGPKPKPVRTGAAKEERQ